MGAVWSLHGGVGPPPEATEAPSTDEFQSVVNVEEEKVFRDEDLNEFYEKREQERKNEMERFNKELAMKKQARVEALASLGRQIATLRSEKQLETELRERAEKEVQELRARLGEDSVSEVGSRPDEEILKVELDEARKRIEEVAESKSLWEQEKTELEERVAKVEELEKQVVALKDVANIGKQILGIRERQVDELNKKLKVIEETGAEYEKEVENIRKLKLLYEERSRAAATEHRVELERERARTTVAETRMVLCRQEAMELEEKNQELTIRLGTIEGNLDAAKEEVSQLKIDLATKEEELYHVKSQMTIVNTLFTQVLQGPDIDFDRLASLLEENHDLINDLTAKGKMEEVASVLMEIAGQESPIPSTPRPEASGVTQNLTKVWRVLVELLSHHRIHPTPQADQDASCYKSVETPRGPRMVISASRTYLKLKDLILEKNSLVKEVGRLKTLNGHLEERLEQQEDRLSTVTSELHKTWSVVSELRKQHKQLHNQEQILRFELKHKRHMLTELKKELEICREQWELARQKNVQTEEDWRVLRAEFASRKKQGCSSTESGYEDEEATASPLSEVEMAEDSCEDEDGGILDDKKSNEEKTSELDGKSIGAESEEVSPETTEGNQPEETSRGRTVLSPEEMAEVFRIAEITDESIIGPDDATNLYKEVLTLEELEDLLQMDDDIVGTPDEQPEISLAPGTDDASDCSVAADITPPLDVSSDCLIQNYEEVQESESLGLAETLVSCPRTEVCDPNGGNIEIDSKYTEESVGYLSSSVDHSLRTPEEAGGSSSNGSSGSNNYNTGLDVDIGTLKDLNSHDHCTSSDLPSTTKSQQLSDILQISNYDNTAGAVQKESNGDVTERVSEPGPSGSTSPARQRTAEEILAARDARLKRLEEQCKSLFTKMSHTSQRGDLICSRLEELHEHYGEQPGVSSETVPQPPVPPPMPPPPPPPMPPRRNQRET